MLRGIGVLVTWSELGNPKPLETDLISAARNIHRLDGLSALINLLRKVDSGANAAQDLESEIVKLFPTSLGRKVASTLALPQSSKRIFFGRWQLLLAIKLLCVFGQSETTALSRSVSPDDILRLLLLINDFVNRDSPDESKEDVKKDPKNEFNSLMLKQTVQTWEQPRYLVGRYHDLFNVRASASRRSSFTNWIDLNAVYNDNFGCSLTEFSAILLGIYAQTPKDIPNSQATTPLPLFIDPATCFRNTAVDGKALSHSLQLLVCTPDQVKQEHVGKYGTAIGRVFDHVYLKRYPVLQLSENCLAALSPQLVVERFTNGVYWDIHDLFPESKIIPNRKRFQSFFGELVEDYGRDTLKRIEAQDRRRRTLILEKDYKEPGERATDGILLEKVGQTFRCTFVEFTVGRPRLMDTVIPGDIESFRSDVERKLGAAADQQLDLLKRLMNGQKTIPGLRPVAVTNWRLCIVVSDPFPYWAEMLSSLSERVQVTRQQGIPVEDISVICLEELEQLETLSHSRRVHQILQDWKQSSYSRFPFGHYYYAHLRRHVETAEPDNKYVSSLRKAAFDMMAKLLFPYESNG